MGHYGCLQRQGAVDFDRLSVEKVEAFSRLVRSLGLEHRVDADASSELSEQFSVNQVFIRKGGRDTECSRLEACAILSARRIAPLSCAFS